jgi:hypothetical protein
MIEKYGRHDETRTPDLYRAVAASPPGARSCPFAAGQRLGDGELAIGAVRNHRLTRLKMELGAIETHRNDVRLERAYTSPAALPSKLRDAIQSRIQSGVKHRGGSAVQKRVCGRSQQNQGSQGTHCRSEQG